jgi:hypothetical protein
MMFQRIEDNPAVIAARRALAEAEEKFKKKYKPQLDRQTELVRREGELRKLVAEAHMRTSQAESAATQNGRVINYGTVTPKRFMDGHFEPIKVKEGEPLPLKAKQSEPVDPAPFVAEEQRLVAELRETREARFQLDLPMGELDSARSAVAVAERTARQEFTGQYQARLDAITDKLAAALREAEELRAEATEAGYESLPSAELPPIPEPSPVRGLLSRMKAALVGG